MCGKLLVVAGASLPLPHRIPFECRRGDYKRRAPGARRLGSPTGPCAHTLIPLMTLSLDGFDALSGWRQPNSRMVDLREDVVELLR